MTAAFQMIQTGLSEIAQASTLRIVDCLVEGTLITIFAGLVLRTARLRNSGTRFAVWFAALVAIAAVPFFGGTWAHGDSGASSKPAGGHAAGVVGGVPFRGLGVDRGLVVAWCRQEPLASSCLA